MEKKYLCKKKTDTRYMKRFLSSHIWLKAWGFLLCTCAMPAIVRAQTGITMYSDTTSVLEDAPADTTWSNGVSSTMGSFHFQGDFFPEGVFDFLTGMWGMTGIMLIFAAIVVFILPLLVIALVIYLIYRNNRMKLRNIEKETYDPVRHTVDEERKEQLLKQAAIKHACWGIGLIATECIIQITALLHVVGVALLCIALYNWLTARIGNK